MANDKIEYRSEWGWGGEPESSVLSVKALGCGYYNQDRRSYSALHLERGVKVIAGASGTPGSSLLFALAPTYTAKQELALSGRVFGAEVLRCPSWNEDDFDETSIATASELAEVLDEINNLAFQDDSDEFGLLRPSYQALATCVKTMLAFVREGEPLRPSDISTDRNGDIRIAWTTEDKEAELIFPSNMSEAPYMYYSSPNSYGTVADISPQTISKWVRWAIRSR